MTAARNKRVRVSVDVDVLASVTFDHAARTLAAPAVHALSHLAPTSYRVTGVSVVNASDGTVVARFAHDGREYVRVATDTGEVLP